MSEKTKGQNLAESLFYKKKNAFELWSAEEREAAQKYCVDYMKFLDDGKTEREALVAAIRILEKEGFREYKLGDKITAGDKLYYNNREKSLYDNSKMPRTCTIWRRHNHCHRTCYKHY